MKIVISISFVDILDFDIKNNPVNKAITIPTTIIVTIVHLFI